MRAPSRRTCLVLVGITAIGAALRWSTLDTQSLDGDELFTAWIVRMDFSHLFSAVGRTESTPYPYYLLTAGASDLLGSGEFALRALSALAGTALIPGMYVAARQFVSSRAALVAAALAAVNPFLIVFSQQARAYSLLFLLATVSLGFCGRYLKTGSTSARRAWGGTGALTVLTHYFGAFIVAAEAVLILLTARRRGEIAAGVRACAVPLVTGVAVLPLAIHQSGNPIGIRDEPLAHRLLQIPKNFLVGFSGPVELVSSVVIGMLVLFGLRELRRRGTEIDWSGSMQVGAIGLLALATPIMLALVGLDFVKSPNVGPAIIPFLVVAGAGFAASRSGLAAALALCAVSIALVIAVAAEGQYQRPNWRGAMRTVGAVKGPRALIVSPGLPAGPLSYYSGPVRAFPDSGAPVCEVSVVALATTGRFTLSTPKPPLLAPGPLQLPAPFHLVEHRQTDTFAYLRFRTSSPTEINGGRLAARLPEEAGSAYVQGSKGSVTACRD